MTTVTRRIETRYEASTVGFDRGARRVDDRLRRLQRTSEGRLDALDRRFERLGSRLGRRFDAAVLAVAIAGVGRAIASVVREAEALRRLDQRFTAVEGSAAAAGQRVREAFGIAEVTGVAIAETAALVEAFGRVGEAAGLTREQAALAAQAVLQLGQLGGATTEDAAKGALAFAEALRDGAVSGDEVNRILEATPLVARRIAETLGLSVDQMVALADQGQLTADQVFGALLGGAADVNDEFRKMPATVEQAAGRAAVSWSRFTTALDESLGVARALSAFLDTMGLGLDRITSGLQGASLAAAVSELRRVQDQIAAAAQGGGAIDLGPEFGGAIPAPDTAALKAREAELLTRIRRLNDRTSPNFGDPRGGAVRPPGPVPTLPIPPSAVAPGVAPEPVPRGGVIDLRTEGVGGGGGRAASVREERDAYAELIAAGRERLAQLADEVALAQVTGEAAAVLAERQRLLADARQAGIALTAEQLAQIDEEARGLAALTLEADRMDQARRLIAETTADLMTEEEQLLAARRELESLLPSIIALTGDEARAHEILAAAIKRSEDEIARSRAEDYAGELFNAARGADSVTEALGRMLEVLVEMAARDLFGEIFGGQSGGNLGGLFDGLGSFIGGLFGGPNLAADPNPFVTGRATGGPVRRGQPYIVGEHRPELFVPSQNGTIIPRVPSTPTVPQIGRGAGGMSVMVEGSTIVMQGSQATPQELERVLDRRDRELVKRIVEMNRRDPTILYT